MVGALSGLLVSPTVFPPANRTVQLHPGQTRPYYSANPPFPGDTPCYVPSTVWLLGQDAPCNGVTGKPTLASPEKGKLYHKHLANQLVETIVYWAPRR